MFEAPQSLIDPLWTLLYADRDPGPSPEEKPAPSKPSTPPAPKAPAKATP